jgi:hypothetical protein
VFYHYKTEARKKQGVISYFSPVVSLGLRRFHQFFLTVFVICYNSFFALRQAPPGRISLLSRGGFCVMMGFIIPRHGGIIHENRSQPDGRSLPQIHHI